MIKVYQYPSCPYCRKVINAITELKLKSGEDYLLIEASHGTSGREEVIRLGGKGQVPFLVDGDVKMYESDDIVQYIRKKFSKA
ncbi:MAG: glutathione S-transferase N-terminal domain-containing protein [Leptospiraceae bacterium]|nr:glutathione S-transferase N-terminal domain-containing protein [Leptospiraceae bacterium]MCP5498504.1 glutathione S-transferase N-terminal domain-containing protein [Leptospiraceae bacterium]